MATKLTAPQQAIVDAMRQGARLIVSRHMDGYWLIELEGKDGELLDRLTERTLDALLAKGVIEPMRRKGYYKLVKEYRS